MLRTDRVRPFMLLLFGASLPNTLPALAQLEWTPHPANPVFSRGVVPDWDADLVLTPTVILTGDTLRMWYSGGADIQTPSTAAIGYATSVDGITWAKYSGNPVMKGRSAEWDKPAVLNPSVIQDGDTLRMWYLAGFGPDNSNIGYATSVDGINWARHPDPVIAIGAVGEWNRDTMLPGPVIKEDGVYKMWFSGGVGGVTFASPNIRTGIGYATSIDGINWSIYDDPATTAAPFQFSDPVLFHGDSGDWDAHEMFTPSVLRTETGYEMWYSGWEYGADQHIGYATSPDGIHWTKHAQNPIATWANFLVYPSVIRDGNLYRMWTSRWIGFATSIEYATAVATPTSVEDVDKTTGIKLNQNYPNPFALQTQISYELAQATHVELFVVDVLGRRVNTLVNASRSAGVHAATWRGDDASGRQLRRGIYFYRIKTPGVLATRGMILR